MKKSLILLFIMITSFGAFAQTTLDSPIAEVRLNRLEVILLSKYQRYINVLQREGSILNAEQKLQLLNTMVNQVLIDQDATQYNIFVTDQEVLEASMLQASQELQAVGAIPAGATLSDPIQFRQFVEGQGMEYELYLENTKRTLVQQRYVFARGQVEFQNLARPTFAEVNDFYNANITNFVVPEYMKVSQIYFDTTAADVNIKRSEAESVFNQLNAGSLAFDDAHVTLGDVIAGAPSRGLPVTIPRGDQQASQLFGDLFLNQLFLGDKVIGRYYFLQSNIGFHIIRVDYHRMAGILALTDPISPNAPANQTVQLLIEQQLYLMKQQELFARLQVSYVQELRSIAQITLHEDLLY